MHAKPEGEFHELEPPVFSRACGRNQVLFQSKQPCGISLGHLVDLCLRKAVRL
jgi:hypothetical protein